MLDDKEIRHLKDSTYQLVLKEWKNPYAVSGTPEKVLFQGTLPEIDAYISLTDKGYKL